MADVNPISLLVFEMNVRALGAINPALSLDDLLHMLASPGSLDSMANQTAVAKALVGQVDAMSEPAAVKQRAAIAEARKSSHIALHGIGEVQKGQSDHVARMTRLGDIRNAEGAINNFRGRVDTTKAELEKAKADLQRSAGGPAYQGAMFAVTAAEGVHKAALADLRNADEQLQKVSAPLATGGQSADEVSKQDSATFAPEAARDFAAESDRKLTAARDQVRKLEGAAARATGDELKKLQGDVGVWKIILNAAELTSKHANDTVAKLQRA